MKLAHKILICVVLVVGGFVAVKASSALHEHRKHKKRQAVERVCARTPSDETIFVSVASYRDPECVQTVLDCFEKASCPFRVHVGVCQQNYASDKDVLAGYKQAAKRHGTADYSRNLKVYTMNAGDAKGPMFARAMIEQNLYDGEKYYLVIDSHTVFTENWDVKAIEDLKACPSEKAVLTMYPDNFESRDDPVLKNTTSSTKCSPPSFLRLKTFNDLTGLPEFEGPVMARCPPDPMPSLFWGACFSFSLADTIREVPFDPTLPYVFLGEEFSMAARLYTHGWDLYTPRSMLVRHMWKRRRPTFWEQFNEADNSKHQERRAQESAAYQRLAAMFYGGSSALSSSTNGGNRTSGFSNFSNRLQPATNYALGTVRSLADYEAYAGINLRTREAAPETYVGVMQSPTTEEIMTKFGRYGKYNALLHKYKTRV